MSENKIGANEENLLSTAITRIISSEVLETSMSDELPLMENLTDSNKIYYGKVSILFVDMRKSTELPDKFSMNQLVKIYRSYIRTVVQAIRYSGGFVRDFMGDGVLSVFIDNEEGKSEDKAVRAARYITTAIDKLLNPVLDQEIKHRISCGIGIHTGNVSLSKVGMKGKEQQSDAENEFGIAWIGNSTNLACKYSGAVGNGTIFISPSTYSELTCIDEKSNWKKVEIIKGSYTLSGYIAERYYLQLDADIIPRPAEDNTSESLVDQAKEIYEKYLDDIVRQVEEMGKRKQELDDREFRLSIQLKEMNRQIQINANKQKALNEREYRFYYDVLNSGHCASDYVKRMGQDFWETNLSGFLFAGKQLGKSEHEVKQEISYAMVSIYESLNQYDKAYDFLVEQATGYSWLLLSSVQNIVKKVGYCTRLKDAICFRLAHDSLPIENRDEFNRIKEWLEQ